MSTIEPHNIDTLKSLDYYHQISESSIDVIYLLEVTNNGRFIYLDVNNAYTEVTGIPRERVIGLCVDEIEDKAFRTILIDKFTACLNAGQKTDYTAEYPFPAGIRTFHSTLSPIRNESGRFHRIVGIARDITEQKRDEIRLRKSEEAYRTLAENSPDIIIRYDTQCRRIYANPTFVTLSGLNEEQIIGKKPTENSPLIAPNYYMAELTKVIEEKKASDHELAVFRPEGDIGWYMSSLVPEFDNHEVVGILCVGRDITHAKAYEAMLQKSAQLEKTMSRMAENLPGFVYTLRRSPDGRASFPYASSGIYTLFGLHPEAVANDMTILKSLIHEEDCPPIEEIIARSAADMTPCNITFRTQIAGREERWIEAKAIPKKESETDDILWHGVMLDVTERKRSEQQIEFMAHHDLLTNLPNRLLAKDRGEQIIARSKRNGTHAAFLFIDLDGFKEINDSMGHSAGDTVLKIIASRLRESIRESDTLCRLGGDEFLLIFSDITDKSHVAVIAEKLLSELKKSFTVNDHTLCVSASIGAAIYPDHSESFELLLKNADTAMYLAKKSGKNGYRFYTQHI